jgi:hypothetical protein
MLLLSWFCRKTGTLRPVNKDPKIGAASSLPSVNPSCGLKGTCRFSRSLWPCAGFNPDTYMRHWHIVSWIMGSNWILSVAWRKSNETTDKLDLRHPPRSIWALRSSRLLRGDYLPTFRDNLSAQTSKLRDMSFVDNCVVVLVICVIVFTGFCVVCTVFLHCYVYVY